MHDFSGTHLKRQDFFGHFSGNVRDRLMAASHMRHYGRGATVCLIGEPAGTLKLVRGGWIKLYRMSANGSEAVLETLRTGQSFDEMAALRGDTSLASAEAVTDCAVTHVNLTAIADSPGAAQEINAAVLRATADHLDGMLNQVEGLKVKTGLQRLSEYLLAHCGDSTGAVRFLLPFDKHLLAALLGMQPESLSRAFSRLRGIGVVTEARRVVIEDVAALRNFSEQDLVLDRTG